MRISVLTDDQDNRPVSHEVSWDDLKGALNTCLEVDCPKTTRLKGGVEIPVSVCSSLHRLPDGSRVPNKCPGRKVEAWSPAIFDGGRKISHVVGMDCLVFDVDHATLAELGAIDAAITREGLAAILHSTHSHDPARDDFCVRIVFKCARPLSPHEIAPTRDALQALIGFRADEQTKDIGRIYYVPTRPKGGPDFFFASVEGRAIDPVFSFQEAPIASPAAPSGNPSHEAGAPVLDLPVEMDPLRARLKKSKSPEIAALMRRVLKGERLAEHGGRDVALLNACGHIAWVLNEQPIEVMLEIMRPSVMAMEPNDKGDWIAEARAKLEKAWERWDTERKRKLASNAVGDRLYQRVSAVSAPDEEDPGNSGPFDETRILEWATENGCADDPERFHKQWIIRFHGANWVFVNGRYMSAVPDEDIRQSLLRDLARAPVEIRYVDAHGKSETRPIAKILDDYCTVPRRVQASLSLQKSFYDPREETFHEAVCPVRQSLKPESHPEILHWLQLFGGDPLLDWVACVTLLGLPAAALYMVGPKGAGKNLLADGLARLWHRGGATGFETVVGTNFNDALTRCPLIFADEGIPKTERILEDLRRLIGARERPLNRKFMSTVNLDGYPRLLITANNDRVLQDTGATLDAEDIAAVAQRIRIIHADEKPVDYVANIRNTKGHDYVESWVIDDKIARCALWLAENRKVNRQTRFLVSSDDPTLSEKIATGTKHVSALLEFLARYMSDSTKIQSPRIKFGDGRLLVNTELMADKNMWERYVPSRKIMSAKDVSTNLRSISEAKAVTVDGLEFHNLKPHILINWAREEQVGSAALIEARIGVANGG